MTTEHQDIFARLDELERAMKPHKYERDPDAPAVAVAGADSVRPDLLCNLCGRTHDDPIHRRPE